jgi:hypothetical protein
VRTRALLVVAGVAAIGYGALGLLRAASDTRPPRWLADLVASSLLHDLLLAPVVLLLLVAGRRWLPRSWRGPAAAFLLIGGSLALVALPVVLGAGARPDNPTLLPRDYRAGLAVTLAVTAACVVVGTLVLRRLRSRRADR